MVWSLVSYFGTFVDMPLLKQMAAAGVFRIPNDWNVVSNERLQFNLNYLLGRIQPQS